MVIARQSKRRWLVGGGVLWIVAAVVYLALEATAAAAFLPGYSYANNYISDLGVTVRGTFSGRLIDSPRAQVMNAAFYIQGALFLGGAVLVALGLRGRRWPFVCGAACNAVGNVLVATVHGGPAWAAGGPTWVHGAGAVLAIVGGNAAVLAGSGLIRAAGGPDWYRAVSICVGVLGLLSVVMLRIDSSATAVDIFPDGVWERASVYSIIGWQLFTGLCLLAWTRGTTRYAPSSCDDGP
jgi:Protein of unknown function (DUF998)